MRVTCIQLEIKDRNRHEALERVIDLLDEARGSDLVLLPELWPCGYFHFASYEAESESVDGPLLRAVGEKARTLGAYVVAGSVVERDGDRLYNTSVVFDGRGHVVARYRKMHLFGYNSQESRLLARGDEVGVFSTPWGKAGLAICYDLRFPELFRKMSEAGAEILMIAAAWPAARIDPWVVLGRARAMENQAFLFACNGAGTTGGVPLGGHSLVVDPLGKVIAEAGEAPCVLSVEVDPASVAAVRREFPALRDRVLK